MWLAYTLFFILTTKISVNTSKHESSETAAYDEDRVFDKFMKYKEIQVYLKWLATRYPEIASLQDIGHSLQGRPLRVLKLSSSRDSDLTSESGSGERTTKPAVFLDAVIHAREWIGCQVVLYAAHRLIFNEQNSSRSLLELADWYILPIANPDGYVHSWHKDRFWRQNRRRYKDEKDCVGVDLNRNFDIHWDKGIEDPHHELYKGSFPHSEPESRAIAKFLLRKKKEIRLYISFHSYGKIRAAEHAAAAIKLFSGTKYKTGSFCELLYPAYGTSVDFAMDVAQIPFAYTWELPAGGSHGFNPPCSKILPIIHESWEGLKILFHQAMQ